MWSPDGKELLFVPRIFGFEAVSVTTQPTFAFGNAVPIPRPFRVGAPNSRTPFDMMPDGRILGLVTPGLTDTITPTSGSRQIQVVLNWFEELKAQLPKASS